MSLSLTRLQSFYGGLDAPLLLHAVIKREFPGSVGLATGFDAQADVLLAMAAAIEPDLPVLFAEVPETPAFARSVSQHLLLQHSSDRPLENQRCLLCQPVLLSQALETMGLLAVITDRLDADLPAIELDDYGVFRIHPLAGWTQQRLELKRVAMKIPGRSKTEKGCDFCLEKAARSHLEQHDSSGDSPPPDWIL